MLPMLIALSVASAFGLMAHAVYGTDGLIDQAWIDVVFWAIISTGAGVWLLQVFSSCLACRLVRLVRAASIAPGACRDCA